jgi:acyl-ACP thioesterase
MLRGLATAWITASTLAPALVRQGNFRKINALNNSDVFSFEHRVRRDKLGANGHIQNSAYLDLFGQARS